MRAWLIVIIGCWALWPQSAAAGVMERTVSHFILWVADPAADYFTGKLLTEHDLAGDQSYQRSGERYIGETELDLGVLFARIGVANVVLLFDEADALFGKRTDVKDSHDRYAEDFIVIDPDEGSWRGRLYLEAQGDIVAGVYDELSGTFRDLVVTAVEPTAALLFFAGAVLAGRWRRRMG